MNDNRLRRLRDHSSSAATLINEGCKISGVVTGTGSFLVNGEIDGGSNSDTLRVESGDEGDTDF